MFKYLLVVALFGACVCDDVVPIVQSESVVEPDGSFRYSFESGDGTKVEQHGEVKTIGNEAAAVAEGAFSYTAPDGQPIKVDYVADENGFQPHGDHILQIPDLIARSLKWNEDHPEPESTRGKTPV